MTLVATDQWEDSDWRRLGQRFQQARGKKSLKQVAEDNDMNSATISRAERGGPSRPHFSTLRLLETYYGWELGEVENILNNQAADKREPDPTPEELQEVIDKLLSLRERLERRED